MADEINSVAQTEQGTPLVEGSESTQVNEDTPQDQGSDTQPGATSETPTKEVEKPSGENGDQSEQEHQTTRAERRIQSLLSKVKENGEQRQPQLPQQFNGQNPPVGQKPIITQEERQTGEVDPDELEKRIQSAIQDGVQKAFEVKENERKLAEAKVQYESAVKDHQADMEGIKDIDPDLEAEAASEYEALNYRINPFTGQQVFIPVVKFSEIVAKIEARAEKLAAKRAEAIAEGNEIFLKKVSSSQAVPTSGNLQGSKSAKPETTDFSEFEKAFSSK